MLGVSGDGETTAEAEGHRQDLPGGGASLSGSRTGRHAATRVRLAFAATCPQAALFRRLALSFQPAGP